ncbi:MAG TPA: carboxypeptidase-like regulatory domain-containing protein [Acidimicrobiia bacterium]|nr:carboxypeptidase-like regulatory domain-containing protein [Acidimicrobiia bacterium]
MIGGGARIEGRAHLADDSSVIEARVFFVTAPIPLPDIAVLTDDDGRFSLHAPTPGTYELACHADGLDPAIVPIEVDGDSESIEVDIELA